jgi:putative transposase
LTSFRFQTEISGKTHYLWRAVDQQGTVLDILVTSRRDTKAATRFFGKLLKGLRYVPRVLVTDKLASYRMAHRRLIPSVEHRRSKYLNNRAENSHQPTRQRERAMRKLAPRVRRSGSFQRFPGSPRTSGPAATGCMLTSTAVRWPPDSPPGTRSSDWTPPPDQGTGSHLRGQHVQPPPTAKQPDARGGA